MGNIFGYNTSYENPLYDTNSFIKDCKIIHECILVIKSDKTNEFYSQKYNYYKRILNNHIQNIPPSKRITPEFIDILKNLNECNIVLVEPIKWTIVAN